MLLNYHEMTINEPRDSSARRQQFIVICTVIATALVYSIFTSGALVPVEVTTGTFPGGVFVYKVAQRDYAASQSLLESIAKDAQIKLRETADVMYTVYLDDPDIVTGRDLRFAAGYLADNKKEQKELAGKLVKFNNERKPPTKSELLDLGTFELWPKLRYESAELPKVAAFVAHFPYTNGFVSAMMHSYKVLPALRKHAAEHLKKHEHIVIYSTCSRPEQMCTHYVPMDRTNDFLLKQMLPEKYAKLVGNTKTLGFDVNSAKRMLVKYVPPLKHVISHEEL